MSVQCCLVMLTQRAASKSPAYCKSFMLNTSLLFMFHASDVVQCCLVMLTRCDSDMLAQCCVFMLVHCCLIMFAVWL